MIHISIDDIQNGLSSTQWDFGNQVLYRLCKENFNHDEEDKILAKVWLIGRSYAAAIERRRNKKDSNDDFYIKAVVPAFLNSELDKHLRALKSIKEVKPDNIEQILATHYYLMQLIRKITGLEKRSFCSKYLHFHLPDLFFIYDSRVVTSLRNYISRVPRELTKFLKNENSDNEYAKYYLKSLTLRTQIESQYKMLLTPRELDKVLILKANDAL